MGSSIAVATYLVGRLDMSRWEAILLFCSTVGCFMVAHIIRKDKSNG